jgi:hypothetical protein
MIYYVLAAAALALGSVLSAAIVIAWAITTDDRYMDTWKR